MLTILKTLPAQTQPMDALRTVVSALAATDPDVDEQRGRRQAPQGDPPDRAVPDDRHRIPSPAQRPAADQPDPSLSLAGNFLYMLTGKKPHDTLTRVMDAALVLHAEHGMNASTFAARVMAATLADMHAAITAAIAALKGPLHGGANQDVMELLLECGDVDAAERKVREMLDQQAEGPGLRPSRLPDLRPARPLPPQDEQATRRGRRQHEVVRDDRAADPDPPTTRPSAGASRRT